jgi:hypothetical protein
MKRAPAELVFLVRMWVQGGDTPGRGEWRGAVQEVASGKRFYVTGARDIADFIDARLTAEAERKKRDAGG